MELTGQQKILVRTKQFVENSNEKVDIIPQCLYTGEEFGIKPEIVYDYINNIGSFKIRLFNYLLKYFNEKESKLILDNAKIAKCKKYINLNYFAHYVDLKIDNVEHFNESKCFCHNVVPKNLLLKSKRNAIYCRYINSCLGTRKVLDPNLDNIIDNWCQIFYEALNESINNGTSIIKSLKEKGFYSCKDFSPFNDEIQLSLKYIFSLLENQFCSPNEIDITKNSKEINNLENNENNTSKLPGMKYMKRCLDDNMLYSVDEYLSLINEKKECCLKLV
jgi:hypothetical protein